MAAIDKVIKWANTDIPAWQGDVVRRFLLQGELTEEDLEILYLQMKKHLGFDVEVEGLPNPLPPKEGVISGSGSGNEALTLKSIECVSNVNAIPDGSILPIAHSGLTVVYGENGTGKSGFARTLKRACNARDKSDQLIGNIFGKAIFDKPSVKFKVCTDDGDSVIDWSEGDADNEVLPKITVLDSSCARVLLDKKNEFQYKPYGTDVFEALVKVIKLFKEKLTSEAPTPSKPLIETLRDDTDAYSFYNELGASSKAEKVAEYLVWSKQEEDELDDLMDWDRELKKTDPVSEIKNKKALISRYAALLRNSQRVRRVFNNKHIESVNAAIVEQLVAEKAQQIAEKAITGGAYPLEGVKSLAWTKLFEAAESYSSTVAYKGQEFPFTGEDAKCVLCMQPLDEDSKDRMQKFLEHIQDDVGKNLKKCTLELESMAEKYSNTNIRSESDLQGLLSEMIEQAPDVANSMIAEYASYTGLREVILESINLKKELSEIELGTFERASAFSWLRTIKKEIEELEKLQNPEEIAKKKKKGKELYSKKALCNRKFDIEKYISESKTLKKYNSALGKLEFTSISKRGREIVGEESTPELQKALIQELEALGITSVKVSFKAHGSVGKTLYDIELTGASSKHPLSKVLSEGEQKAIAIASFMAELKLAGHCYPIVFDDPVTSLDHKFRDRIAERIARASCSRQVIVFTHDISFLMELEKHVGRLNSERAIITLRHNSTNPGEVSSEQPWSLMKVGPRLTFLEEAIGKAKPIYESDRDQYDKKAMEWYSLFRETWEAIVEEVIFNSAIRRFGAEIKTMSVREVEITDDCYKILHNSMGKASEWMAGHDKSKELSIHRPPPTELSRDLAEARKFIAEAKKNKKAVSERRKKLLEPLQADIG